MFNCWNFDIKLGMQFFILEEKGKEIKYKIGGK